MIDYKKELNEAQYNAVKYIDGPELVIAGAGSGKTRVLIYKIAYLLEQGFAPNRILALTFTNKAAKEMQDRIGNLVNKDSARKLVMGTFHGFCRKILSNEIKLNEDKELLPFNKDFVIYDKGDSEDAINDVIEEMGLDNKIYHPSDVLNQISRAKNMMITADQYINHSLFKEDYERHLGNIHNIYKRYQLSLRKANAMDFDDLLFYVYQLFMRNKERRIKYSCHFQYCLVDEYQDTNILQKELLKLLVNDENRICVVGDDAQSIYAFRGAVIENILNFDQDYSNVAVFKLEENYRSTKTIVQAANSVIKVNTQQLHKELFSNNPFGEDISVIRCNNEKGESNYVIKTIKAMLDEGYSLDDFAILYRSNWLSKSFEDSLIKANIPYKVFNATSFYQRKEIKDLLCYFRVVVNPKDQQALCRIINYPARGIGKSTVNKLLEISMKTNKSLWEIMNLYQYIRNIFSKSVTEKIILFTKQIKDWQLHLSEDAYYLASRIIQDSGIIKFLSLSQKTEDIDRAQNCYQLLGSIKEFVDERRLSNNEDIALVDYLREVSLLSDSDDDSKEKRSFVKLMTVHSSKGLEFPIVFVVGLDENIFPSSQCVSSLRYVEEERRLFYVAITRAKKKLFLTGAHQRFSFGKTNSYEWSRFIYNIDKSYLRKGY